MEKYFDVFPYELREIMGIVKANDFREIILQAFREKEKQTVGYSMRQFAKFIHISPAKLSMVMSGKIGISPIAANEMADKLGFSEDDKDYFVTLVGSRHHRSAQGRRVALEKLKSKWGYLDFDELSEGDLSELSDWTHFAILHLVELKNFEQGHEWISQRLGLPIEQVKKAVEDLFRHGFLVEEQGRWVCDSNKLKISVKGKSEALRNMHSQLIMKAHDSVYDDTSNRHLSTNFLTLSPAKMEEARHKIREFALSMISELSDKSSPDDRVCALGIQLFNLEKPFDQHP